jgi:hypothetical protein
MSRQCPFPVRASDTRRCYRTGNVPGFALSLALIAALFGYAGLSDAAPATASEYSVSPGAVVDWAKGRLLVAPRL